MRKTADLGAAVAWLASRGVVAFPTDTQYGLAADPRSEAAVGALFGVKGRPANEPVPLVAASRDQVEQTCGPLEGAAARLAEIYWPGPLSLLVATPVGVVAQVHAGTGSVAIRVPAHPLARALAEAFGFPVTATSANRHRETAAIRVADLGALGSDWRVLVLDGGEVPGGPPSTIVDAREAEPACVREGAIAWNRVLESLHG